MFHSGLILLTRQSPGVFNFLYTNWAFAIPFAFLVFSIIIWIFGTDKLQVNLKRVFYSISILLYLIFIRSENVTTWCTVGQLGISAPVWSQIVSLITAFIIAMVIDNFIISGYIFKEFGIFGAKFIREETQQTVIQQDDYSMVLEKSLESLYYVLEQIHLLFLDNIIIESVKDGSFKYIKQFADILAKYYEYKAEKVFINVQFYKINETAIKKIIGSFTQKYRFDILNLRYLKSCLSSVDYGTSGYFDLSKSKVFIITAKVKHSKEDEMLLISIESKKEINIYDFYPILCCLNNFEIEISKI